MPLEIEAKMKVTDLAIIRERLREAGATRLGRHFETNGFFDTPDQSLFKSDRGLRLRHALNVERGAVERFTITYKGPPLPGALKSREEIEINVDDGAAAKSLLEALGYAQKLSFEKWRESWELLDCHVELDELPHIGSFVEIEGPSDDAVMKARIAIGLSDRPIIKTSYIAMLVEYLRERQIERSTITFSGT
jgi:adenylate cyclase class 2